MIHKWLVLAGIGIVSAGCASLSSSPHANRADTASKKPGLVDWDGHKDWRHGGIDLKETVEGSSYRIHGGVSPASSAF